MLRRSSLVLAFSLAMPLLSLAPPGHAAPPAPAAQPSSQPTTQPKVLKQAVGESDPFVITFVDSADGKLSTDSKFASQIHDLFADTAWLFLDDGSLVIGQKNGDKLDSLFNPAMLNNDKNTYFLFHLRTNAGLFLDGTVNVSSKDPTQAFAEMTLLMMGDKGASATSHIEQVLTVQGQPAPQTQPSGLPSVP
jgi:hypothetical protein